MSPNPDEKLPIGDSRHGLNGYCNLKCRCGVCRAANAAWQREARKRRKAALGTSAIQHGTRSTYQNYGCRCRPCVAAQTAAGREWRSNRAAISADAADRSAQ